MTRQLEVGPTESQALPGDERVIVDLGDKGPTATKAAGQLRGVDASGAATTPILAGAVRRTPTGTAIVEVVVDGWRFELEVEDAGRAALRRRATRLRDAGPASGPAEIRAIIPGRVAAVRVAAGDSVEAGQALLVVEAMKMQNELRAPRAGTIERVAVEAGQTIDHGDLLVILR